jgi:hypothetical protein
MLTTPAIMALLHVPLACQWVWDRTFGVSMRAARQT